MSSARINVAAAPRLSHSETFGGVIFYDEMVLTTLSASVNAPKYRTASRHPTKIRSAYHDSKASFLANRLTLQPSEERSDTQRIFMEALKMPRWWSEVGFKGPETLYPFHMILFVASNRIEPHTSL